MSTKNLTKEGLPTVFKQVKKYLDEQDSVFEFEGVWIDEATQDSNIRLLTGEGPRYITNESLSGDDSSVTADNSKVWFKPGYGFVRFVGDSSLDTVDVLKEWGDRTFICRGKEYYVMSGYEVLLPRGVVALFTYPCNDGDRLLDGVSWQTNGDTHRLWPDACYDIEIDEDVAGQMLQADTLRMVLDTGDVFDWRISARREEEAVQTLVSSPVMLGYPLDNIDDTFKSAVIVIKKDSVISYSFYLLGGNSLRTAEE